MAEEQATENTEEEQSKTEQPQAQPEAKHETDWKAEARKWEARAKENKGAAAKLTEIEEASKTELQRARERAEKAEAEAKRLQAETERRASIDKVASETGIPASVLSRMVGDTEEEIRANAEALKSQIPAYPTVNAGKQAEPKMTEAQVAQIKDKGERIRAYAELHAQQH